MKIEINAKERKSKGTGASRRLRHEGTTPGILYGGVKDAISLEIDSKELFMQFRHEAFHASILTLNLEGKKESVILRDFQMHPVRNNIQHIDFQRINENEKISVKVPFHFINEETAPGVKIEGGLVSHIMTEIDISCLPKDLPQYIEVDLGELAMGESIHLSEVTVPEGVELSSLTEENDPAITSISKPKVVIEEEIVTEASEEGEEGEEGEGSESSDDSGSDAGEGKSDDEGRDQENK
ncbi:50S ribosomal protein L25/general stress protein Ctc [Methylophilaceae bacterium]|nr:50S ribosomal protein L25/general stress protein Ctc [Methylophilaceae bacterium]